MTTMSKGTIIYIGGFELPDKNAAAHRVLSNGKILKELGYNVVYISIDNKLSSNSNILNTKNEIQGFESWYIPYPKTHKQWLSYLCDIKQLIKVIDNYSDVKAIICYNYQAIAFIKIISYCKKRNIKIMADCTEWYSTKGNNILFKIIKGTDSFLRMQIIQKHLDGLIVISRYLETYYKKCKNVILIPPLVDLNEEKWNQPMFEYNDNKIHVVYAGNPGYNKDKLNYVLEHLLKVDYKKIVLNIIGISREEYIRYYPEHADLLDKIHETIHFWGKLSHIETLKHIKSANFTIFLRDNDRLTNAGFPTKFVESISCGTPVISNDSSNITDYLYNEINGFIIGENVYKDLNNIINKNPEQLHKMKNNVDYKKFDYRNWNKNFTNFFTQ